MDRRFALLSPLLLVIMLCLCAWLPVAATAGTVHVAPVGDDVLGDGSAVHPFRTITTGLGVAVYGDTVQVAAGSYDAAAGELFPIALKSGVALQGAGAETTTIEGDGAHSVFVAGGISEVALAGLTISGGYAAEGGAITSSGSTLALSGCTLSGNTGTDGGGAVALVSGSSLTVDHCSIESNTGGAGGALNANQSTAVITDSSLSGNSATGGAGAVMTYWASLTLRDCVVSDNSAPGTGALYMNYHTSGTIERCLITGNRATVGAGGALSTYISSPTFVDNVICDNQAAGDGGALYLNGYPGFGSSPTLRNNTIAGNTAGGTGIVWEHVSVDSTIVNCIIWNEGDDLYDATATHSDIEDGDGGAGNLSLNPLFVDAASGDYHLQAGSPCIDSGTNEGTPSADLDLVPCPQDGDNDGTATSDMGTFERPYMAIASGATHTAGADVGIASSFAGATQMRLRNSGDTWSTERAYESPTAWSLTGGEGVKTVEVEYAYAGGRTLVVSDSIVLDSAAPATTDNAPTGWVDHEVDVTLTATDGGGGGGGAAGIEKTWYRVDGGDWAEYAAPARVSGDAAHTLDYYSVDRAGNAESAQQCQLLIDVSPPTPPSSFLSIPAVGEWTNETTFVSRWAGMAAAPSGIEGFSYSWSRDAETPDTIVDAARDARPQVASGYIHTVGFRNDGTAVAAGYNDVGQSDVSGWSDITGIAAGWGHTVGLRGDGTAVATGSNAEGQCDVSGWADITAVAANWLHTVGLKSDGTVVAAGRNVEGQCDVSGWADITSLSAGWRHTLGLRSDGTVAAVGNNTSGQCDVSGWADITAVAAGQSHSVGLKRDGTVVATDSAQNVSGWSNITAVAAGSGYTVGLERDGTVVAVGSNNYGQCNVSGWSDITDVAAGFDRTVGLKSDGTIVVAGYKDYGSGNVSGWSSIHQPTHDTRWDRETLSEGEWYLNVRTRDRAGNWSEASHVGPFQVDTGPPETTDSAPSGWHHGDAAVVLTASDSGSGIDKTWYRLDGGEWIEYLSAIAVSTGIHELQYYSLDKAGHEETPTTKQVRIHSATPTLCVAPDGNDTTGVGSPAQPYRTITKALAMCLGGVGETIQVAAGSYDAAAGESFPIVLKSSVSLQGAGRDVTTIAGDGAHSCLVADHVNSVGIDGLTISGGYSSTFGGGLWCDGSGVALTGCRLTGNSASLGAGVAYSASQGRIEGNIVDENTAAAVGAGVYCEKGSSPDIVDNLITQNTNGGLGCDQDADPLIARNTITYNTTAVSCAAGMEIANGSQPVIVNNVIAHNTTLEGAPGMAVGGVWFYNGSASPAVFANNTVVDNVGVLAGGIGDQGFYLAVTGCIIRNPGQEIGILESIYPTVTYSDVEGGHTGEGNVDADPLFLDAGAGDYRLQAGSPCIDGGTNEGAPTSDKDAKIRPIDGDADGATITDIGAYEAGATTVVVGWPNGGEEVAVDTNYDITWQVSATVAAGWFDVWVYSPSSGWFKVNQTPVPAVRGRVNYSAAWFADQAPADDYKVRVWYYTSHGTPGAYDDSDAAFALRPLSVRVTEPNDGQTYQRGSLHNLSWDFWHSPAGAPSSGGFRVWAYGDPGWFELTSKPLPVVVGQGSYSQTVALNLPPGDYTLRVYHITEAGVWRAWDDSDQVFHIAPVSLTVDAPNYEDLIVDQNYDVRWHMTEPVDTGSFDVYAYSATAGWHQLTAQPVEVVAGRTNYSFRWFADEPPENDYTYKIRVWYRDAGGIGVAYDDSDFAFALRPLTMRVTEPNDGQTYQRGSLHNLSWDFWHSPAGAPSSGSFRVWAYGAMGWYELTSKPLPVVVGQGSYTHTVPLNLPTGDYTLRVYYISEAGVWRAYDDSDQAFHVAPVSLTIDSPNGYEDLYPDRTQDIRWHMTEPVDTGSFDVYAYSAIAGWHQLTAQPVEVVAGRSAYSFRWFADEPPENDYTYKIRVWYRDANGVGVAYDDSDFAFALRPLTMRVTEPNDGQTYQRGSLHNLSWDFRYSPAGAPSSGSFRIWAYGDPGWFELTTKPLPVVSGQGSYTQAVALNLPTGDYTLRVYHITEAGIWRAWDDSDQVFHVAPVSLTVDWPNGGDDLSIDHSYDVRWHMTEPVDTGSFDIWAYSATAGWHQLTAQPVEVVAGRSAYSFRWFADEPPENDYTYKIRIWYRDSEGVGVAYDDSDAAFALRPLTITMQWPNGGESYLRGSVQQMRWNVSAPVSSSGTFRVWVSRPGEPSYELTTTPISGVAGEGSFDFTWVASQPPGVDYRVSVTYTTPNGILRAYDTSDFGFTIAPVSLAVMSPNGSEAYRQGEPAQIAWQTLTPVSTGRFEIWAYSPSTSWYLLTPGGVPAVSGLVDYSYDWSVAEPAATDYHVRIWYRAEDGSAIAADDSDATFRIDEP